MSIINVLKRFQSNIMNVESRDVLGLWFSPGKRVVEALIARYRERSLSIALLLLKDLPFQIMTSDKPVGQLLYMSYISLLSGGNLVCPKPFVLYLSFWKWFKLVKTADLQAHNASHREALCACRSAVFTTVVRRPCTMKQGFTLRKNLHIWHLEIRGFGPTADYIHHHNQSVIYGWGMRAKETTVGQMHTTHSDSSSLWCREKREERKTTTQELFMM